MSLVHKPEMTEKNLAAHRANGAHSRGAVTPEGKARVAAANLRHGFYARVQNGALPALGEDPREYADHMNSLENNLLESLEGELVQRIGDTLWRMKRAARMQNGLAAKRVRSGVEKERLIATPMLLHFNAIYEGLCAIGRMLNRDDPTPAPGEIQGLENAFGTSPPEDVGKLFPLLRAYGEAAAKAPTPANANADVGPTPLTAEGQARQAAHQQLYAALDHVIMPFAMHREALQVDFDNVDSAENIAALMAPQDEKSLLMQRMEDSNLRQLWRITNILVKVRNGALSPRDVKNEATSGDVHENTSDDDNMSSEKHASLQENAPIAL